MWHLICENLFTNGLPNTQQIWTRSAEPFLRCSDGVCTCARADTPPVTTGCTVPNGFLKTYQISTQSARPLPSYSKRVFFSTAYLRCAPRAAVVTHITRYNSHRQERRWSYPSEKTACQSDLRFKSYKFLHNITCERFDGVYGRCKSGINSLLISRWKPSINWQKTLFLIITSTNSTRAAAAKSLFRAKCRCLKGSVLVARIMNSGRACRSSGRVFSVLKEITHL